MYDSISDTDQTLLKNSTELGHIKLHLEFTGSGSEYFRIWAGNLLLTLLTLGLYYPWAKVRRLRYFYGNIQVDGDPLDFHGDPRTVGKGCLRVATLFSLSALAVWLSPAAGFAALLAVVGLWPALYWLRLQFHLAHTSWRGLRFRFKGSLRGAYAATVPLCVTALALFTLALVALHSTLAHQWLRITAAVVVLCALAWLPWQIWNLKNYQHMHYALGHLQTQFKATPANFYRYFFKLYAIGFSILAGAAALSGAERWTCNLQFEAIGSALTLAGAVAAMPAGCLDTLASSLAVFIGIGAYATSRSQNLVWTQTGNRSIRFISALRFRPLLWLKVKNALLIVLTLGLYWPFAAIAVTRMRVEAIRIKTRIDPNTLVGSVRAAEAGATKNK